MILAWLSRRDDRPYQLYVATVEQARHPALYQRCGVPDTLDGRFDMILMHLALVLERLRGETGRMPRVGRAVLDVFLADMDQNLRQMGVGDLTVPKRIKRMGEAFYGRYNAYTKAVDEDGIRAAIARNVFPDAPGSMEPVAGLTRYFIAARALLRTQDVRALELGRIEWPDPSPGPETSNEAIPDQPVDVRA